MNMEKITKTFEFSNVQKKEKGYSAIVSTFTVKDSHGDRIQFGAFANGLKKLKESGGSVPVLFQHNLALNSNVGYTTNIAELEPYDPKLPEMSKAFGGLFVEFDFLDDDDGRKAKDLLEKKVYQQFSVGMYVYDYEIKNDDWENWEAVIKEADLVEYSMVLRGANPLTGLVSMKDLVKKNEQPTLTHHSDWQYWDKKAKEEYPHYYNLDGTPKPMMLVDLKNSPQCNVTNGTSVGIVPIEGTTTIKVGREISQSNLDTLKGAIESIDGASEQLKSITSKFEQQEEKENIKAIRERLVKLKARRLKHIIERNTK